MVSAIMDRTALPGPRGAPEAEHVSASFLHPSMTGRRAAALAEQLPRQPGPQWSDSHLIDWRAVRRATRACCCTARPSVIAVIRPSAGRPHLTELLLCWHHYRLARRALDASGVTVLDIDGNPVGDALWPTTPGPVSRR
jgi:hypothetical protein